MTLSVHVRDGHKVLRVTAELDEPVIYTEDGMALDGPIAHGVFLLLDDAIKSSLPKPDESPFAEDFRLPLSTWSCKPPHGTCPSLLDADGRLWGWLASQVQAEWSARGAAQIRQRPPMREYAELSSAKKVDIKAGVLRAHDLTLPTVSAREVSWLCVGDKSLVRRYVRLNPAIGRKVNLGNGRVRRWRVEVAEGVTVQDVIDRCRLPATARRGDATILPIRAPYWHRSRNVLAVDPGC